MTDLNAAGTPQVLYVTAAMLSEMTSLAKAREYSLSDLIFDAWELGKHQLSTREEADHPVTLEKRPLKRAANENGVAPDLDRTSEKVGHTFHFDSTTLSELSEVATALDRSLSWVLQNAYLIARPALQRSKS